MPKDTIYMPLGLVYGERDDPWEGFVKHNGLHYFPSDCERGIPKDGALPATPWPYFVQPYKRTLIERLNHCAPSGERQQQQPKKGLRALFALLRSK